MKTLRKQLVSSAGCSILALVVACGAAATAQAQEQPSPASTQTPSNATLPASADKSKPEAAASAGEILVTGSRVRHDNFNAATPITIISRDSLDAAGERDIATALQDSGITSGTSQVNGAFLGFVSEDGAAANTVGLRGLGSERTLVLLNGRRLAPSGVGPQLIAADLNVLPDAIVEQIDVLKEGASSVYGSDAIAGVVNIITDTKVNGVTLSGYDNQPLDTGGAGGTQRLSIVAGKVFDRGHITASFEYKNEEGLIRADRSEFTCPRDLIYNQTSGQEVGSIDPATGGLSCYPYALGSGVGIASGYGIAESFTTGALNRITYANGNINNLQLANGIERVSPSPVQNQETVISPLKTYTGYLNGSYELEMLGDAEIYGEALFTRRDSRQQAPYQLSITQSQLSPNVQIYGGSYAGAPLSQYGTSIGHPIGPFTYSTSPFFPNSLAKAGYNYFTPFIIAQQLEQSTQRIDYVRANGGLRGNLGIGDWRYDANFQYAHTASSATSNLIEDGRLNNVLQAVVAPAGTPANLTTAALPGQAGYGNTYTCAANVSASGAYIPGSTCAPLNLYAPSVVLNGQIPSAVYNYLFQNETDHTKYTETIASLNLDGTLFHLPAGTVKAALGYEHRYDSIDDVPPLAAQNGQLYNYSSGGITTGSDTADEVYGEVDVPLLKDKPFAKYAEIRLSGRFTHYQSYGSDFTYHIDPIWNVNSVLSFRGNYGTSFRAPDLYEQFVANQTGFLGSGSDPCSGFASTYSASSQIYKNCLAQLSPILGTNGALNYIATSGPEQITKGGAGYLKAETSTSWGFGTVLTAPVTVADLSLAVDYWNVKVSGEIDNLGSLILNRCYEAADFPNNTYCSLIAPREVGGAHPGNLVSFNSPYLNVSFQQASGIDFDLRYATHIEGGRFIARLQATRNLHQEFQQFAGDPIVDYNGTLGQQGAGAGPKLVANLALDYTVPSGLFKIHYGLKYVGKQDSTALVGPIFEPDGLGQVNAILVAEPYWEHYVSVDFYIKGSGKFTIGVNNLTDSHPPLISQVPSTNGEYTRIGNYFNSSNYDYYGRSVFAQFTTTFK